MENLQMAIYQQESDMGHQTLLEGIVNSIPRINISSLTPQAFLEQYQKLGRPVVITGLLQTECDWNLDYLCENLGKREVLLRFYGRERYKQDKRQWKDIGSGVEPRSMLFAQYAELLRNQKAREDDIYLARSPLKGTPLAEAAQSLNTVGERLNLGKLTRGLSLWVGPTDHREALHYDPVDVVLMQLHGAKHVVLFPPSETHNLYPFPLYVHLRYGLKLRCWCSQVYPTRPDFKAFPRLREALQHKHEVKLAPGEVLYLPAGWWHEVTTVGQEMVCSVNQTWSVHPSSRALLSWNRWRIFLGVTCALPHTLLSILLAMCSSERKQKLSKIGRLV